MGIRDSAPAYIALNAVFSNASGDAGSVFMPELLEGEECDE